LSSPSSVALLCSKTRGRLLALHKKEEEEEEEEDDGSVVVVAFFHSVALRCNVAFFAMLRCSATPQEQMLLVELRCTATYLVELRCSAAPQTNKQNKRDKKSKMFTLVPLWLSRGSRSGSSRSPTPSSLLQAPAPSSPPSSPAPSSLPLDVSRVLAME
jgi:hypothetical protein